jgi:hypothetical protein
MSKLLTFIRDHVGKQVRSPGGEGGQCVDLVELWLLALDHPTVPGNAVDLWRNAPTSAYELVANGPANAPAPGDVVVWHRAPAVGIGPDGHTAVAVAADSMTLLTLDQNWPSGAYTALIVHPYTGVTGWLHPR